MNWHCLSLSQICEKSFQRRNSGNLDQAQEFMESFPLTPDSENIQFYRAVVTYEILSDRPKALDCLEAALEAGYPLIEIYNDPELSKLRQDPAYHRLLAKTQAE